MRGAVFVAGGSRGVGREIVRCLVAQGTPTVAMVRSPAAQPELEAMGATVVQADALDPAATLAAMQTHPIQAVISTIGGLPQDGQRSDYLGNKHLIDAAVAVGVDKFILVSSIGSGTSRVALAPPVLEALGPVLAEKEQAEAHLVASGLTYVVVRPGGLLSEPATGTAVLTPDPTISGSIHRADVAALVCQCLQASTVNNQILSAIDRQRLSKPGEFEIVQVADA